jgi:hypothetical protein
MSSETTGERTFRELSSTTVAELTTAEQFVLGVCRCWDAFMVDEARMLCGLAWR